MLSTLRGLYLAGAAATVASALDAPESTTHTMEVLSDGDSILMSSQHKEASDTDNQINDSESQQNEHSNRVNSHSQKTPDNFRRIVPDPVIPGGPTTGFAVSDVRQTLAGLDYAKRAVPGFQPKSSLQTAFSEIASAARKRILSQDKGVQKINNHEEGKRINGGSHAGSEHSSGSHGHGVEEIASSLAEIKKQILGNRESSLGIRESSREHNSNSIRDHNTNHNSNSSNGQNGNLSLLEVTSGSNTRGGSDNAANAPSATSPEINYADSNEFVDDLDQESESENHDSNHLQSLIQTKDGVIHGQRSANTEAELHSKNSKDSDSDSQPGHIDRRGRVTQRGKRMKCGIRARDSYDVGEILYVFTPNTTPNANGFGWSWQDCASMCAVYDGGACSYWVRGIISNSALYYYKYSIGERGLIG
jgi:hypothetical protein